MLPLCDLSTTDGRARYETLLERLRHTASMRSDAGQVVSDVVEAVRTRGDDAVVQYMRQWTDDQFTADRLRVTADELANAEALVDPALMEAIDTSIAQVTEYQRHVMPRDVEPVTIGGAELGMKWTAVDSAGLLVPGGTAVLFSTLIMLAVPAIVAGVKPENLSVAHPPPTRRGDEQVDDISPIVLATAHRLGIQNVYRIGGAQGVAALAYGTETIAPIDLVAGPGNVFVQLAKTMVNGVCGTDNGFYGPSEITSVVDDSANPAYVAADLIAQAEHDPGKCFLVAWSREVINAVMQQVDEQLKQRQRTDAIVSALENESCAVLVADEAEAVDVTNTLACEHVNLAVADPKAFMAGVKHAGEVFLGDKAPVASGDYYAGPSHCLPTGTTARFASGVSVYSFLKRTGTVAYPNGLTDAALTHIPAMAEAEGLDGHAASVRVRGQGV